MRRVLVKGVGEIPGGTSGWIHQHPRVCGDAFLKALPRSSYCSITCHGVCARFVRYCREADIFFKQFIRVNVGFTWHCWIILVSVHQPMQKP